MNRRPTPESPHPEDRRRPHPSSDPAADLVPGVADVTPRRIAELIERIRESADKLARDQTSRGDLKILSRTLRELRYAFKVFSPYRGYRKVTVFGSARTPPDQPAYGQAVEFGRRMAEQGWLVVTGAASGIMEAGHVGAGREHSMGLNILLPFEQSANRIIAGDPKLVHMKYFFTRKLMFVKESDAICLLPGGFGTLDEGLEVLTLLQTGKRDMVPVVLLDEPGGDYWAELPAVRSPAAARPRHDLPGRPPPVPPDRPRRRGGRGDPGLLPRVPQHAVRAQPAGAAAQRAARARSCWSRSTRDFADLLAEGRFTLGGPLPEEKDEPDLAASAAAGLPLQPPQLRPAAAVDRLLESRAR